MTTLTYCFLRVSDTLVLPREVSFSFSWDDRENLVCEVYRAYDLGGVPFQVLRGEVATALRAFLEGTYQFPVNEAGVVNIPAGWEAAQGTRSFAGLAPVLGPAVGEPVTLSDTASALPLKDTAPEPVAGSSSRLDVNKITDKIAKRVKGAL